MRHVHNKRYMSTSELNRFHVNVNSGVACFVFFFLTPGASSHNGRPQSFIDLHFIWLSNLKFVESRILFKFKMFIFPPLGFYGPGWPHHTPFYQVRLLLLPTLVADYMAQRRSRQYNSCSLNKWNFSRFMISKFRCRLLKNLSSYSEPNGSIPHHRTRFLKDPFHCNIFPPTFDFPNVHFPLRF